MTARPNDMDEEAGPERTCVVTRARLSPEAMIRFVAGPAGEVVPDIRRRLPGRGVWVSADAAIVRQGIRGGAFARGLKAAVKAPETLAEDVDVLLERDALQSLGMANKAGLVVLGAAKVEAQIARRDVVGLLQARDGGSDGGRKMAQALRRSMGGAAETVPIVDLFQSSQLDLALGRTNVIHAALRQGAASLAFLGRCGRLARYRGDLSGVHDAGQIKNDTAHGDSSFGGRDD
ncbi:MULTISPECIES: RNA-binding protein [unclassified Beijerinckia]|uniref:RNA-binding protein n=1 Tax=unclassified Beijerinckia TaxID=2638183 RepID=UPI000894965C|nr:MULTISPECIES: RNA-binding protein [unclassified Beijerinckia]MDH7797886.1 putative RNA-binding protein YlxR (DUF448 family) [Beijerinckia sp. GAS462]SED01801.1 hypothetical protein SAMN05443249_4178 [Beijerinckia sp. 28-YEA-48]